MNACLALSETHSDWTVALFGNSLLDDDGLLLHQENSGGAVKGIITAPCPTAWRGPASTSHGRLA